MLEAWTAWMEQGMLWIEQSGWIGWIWFIILYTLSCVFFLPGSVLSFGAGAVYGFWSGTLLVSLGSVAGALANFVSTRSLLSRISFLRFLLASWVGFLPISAAYSYGGAVIGRAAKGGLHQGPWAWVAYTMELAITVLITIWITRFAQNALRNYAPEVAEAIAEEEDALPPDESACL